MEAISVDFKGFEPNPVNESWKSKYNGMEVADVVRLKELEADNVRMQRIIAKLTLKVDAMDELIRKRLGPSQRQEAVRALQTRGLSQREATEIGLFLVLSVQSDAST